ncbi:MAG: hypothetical protein LWX56_01685 [Ignavibacteria bacterium]|nr:hypothetical protein [Ignavibacteria bacterium]
MKSTVTIVVCMLWLSTYTLCQEKPFNIVIDTQHVSTEYVIPPRLSFYVNGLHTFMPYDSTFNSPIFLDYNLYLLSFEKPDFRSSLHGKDLMINQHLSQQLLLQYQKAQEMSPYYYILGIAQGAACGYALYEHVKKYGLK